jgi:hypothetical protein
MLLIVSVMLLIVSGVIFTFLKKFRVWGNYHDDKIYFDAHYISI